ncbi:MAG TPA: aminotransferase class V-fold PLP-dependent enzyme [Candidatus Dormibacteraeota bacterium]|nr:aminotransferase class V-fold PLP-dependent enzyme [Candidatus Dormibacteraeota bacterium]
MTASLKSNRRTFLGAASAVAAALLSPRKFFASTHTVAGFSSQSAITGFGATGNVYQELGVPTVINGEGTMTVLGGSLMRPEVEAVMALAGRHFVSIADLEVAAGQRISEMLKLPEGYSAIVTSGAAAAMQSGLAGILTGNNPKFIEQLPDLTGMKSEVIIQKSHRNPFDHQLRATGIKLVVVETREDVKKAINPQTAMMHFSNFANFEGQIRVEDWLKLAHDNGVPAFIDAAADTPPVSHLWDYAQMGYDLIAFSGGKAIRGPQCAGMLIGKKDLVANALLNNSPHEDTLGRSQKVGKEEIVGMVKALEIYLKEDHEALNREWQQRLELISKRVTKIPGVTTSYSIPAVANRVPHMTIALDPKRISITPRDASASLRKGNPSIVLSASEKGLEMNSFMLQPGEDQIIADRLAQLLESHAS